MVKKGGIRFDGNEHAYMPIFGEQEIEVPEYLAEPTKKGYKLVPTLTKSGAISKRHKEPAIKIVAKDIDQITISKNKVERLALADFIRTSKLELEKQYAKYIELQHKLVDVEMEEVLMMPEVRAAIMEADDKPAAVEEIRKVVEAKIIGPTYAETSAYENVLDELKTKSGKKLTLGRIEEKMRDITHKMAAIVKKEKPLMLKRGKADPEITAKQLNFLKDFVKSPAEYFYKRMRPTLNDRYTYEKEGILSKSAADAYHKLGAEREALTEEFNERKAQYSKNRSK